MIYREAGEKGTYQGTSSARRVKDKPLDVVNIGMVVSNATKPLFVVGVKKNRGPILVKCKEGIQWHETSFSKPEENRVLGYRK